MKRSTGLFFMLFAMILLLQVKTILAETQAESVLLQADNFEHIQFGKIKANSYTYHDQLLKIDVDSSASFLMKPFDVVNEVNKVSFEWRSKGTIEVQSEQHESKRNGDDAVFKFGLLLAADNSLPNPFLPPWMKRVEKLLKFPSEKMIYLVADAKHAPGRQWPNPYNKRVTMVSIRSVPDHQGWMKASYQFKQPVNVVALWLMADGDNTQSSFTTQVKNIRLE